MSKQFYIYIYIYISKTELLYIYIYIYIHIYIYIYIYNNSVLCKYSFAVKTVPFQAIQFSINTQFKRKYGLIGKNISISSYSISNSSNSNNLVWHKYAGSINHSIYFSSFVCTQLNYYKRCYVRIEM